MTSLILALATVFILNEDNDHYFKKPASEMTREALVSYVDNFAQGHVTHFFMCPSGQRASFDSKTVEPIWAGIGETAEFTTATAPDGTHDRWALNAKKLFDAGIDPYEVWTKRCREKGVSPWFTIRMNDVHGMGVGRKVRAQFRTTNFHRSRRDLWRDPETKDEYWQYGQFDYSRREVRNYALRHIREVAERWDMDGIELDWMRFGYSLAQGRERVDAHILTSFVRDVRALLDEVGRKRGRRIRLGCRVPRDVRSAKAVGLDVGAWLANRSLDLLVPHSFLAADVELPVDEWIRFAAARDPNVRVIPGIDSCNGRAGGKAQQYMTPALYRGCIERFYARGATGIYFFNLPYLACADVLYREGIAPETVAAQPKEYPEPFRDFPFKGRPREVPELLRTTDGKSVTDVRGWEARRAEIREIFLREIYGRRPGERPARLSFAPAAPDRVMLDGKAVRKMIRVSYGDRCGDSSFVVTAFVPATATKAKPAPAFLLVCNRDPKENLDPERNVKSGFWPVEQIVARGYAAIAFYNGDVARDWDRATGFRDGVFGVFEDPSERTAESWGILSAWAWGASRVMDWIATEPTLDAAHVGVVGHSRGGKTSLLAAVTDTRFAMACVNDSGCGGAKLNHMDLPLSEHFDQIAVADAWFCGNFAKYLYREHKAPFDAHWWAALVAPRLLAIASASEDDWAGQEGEFQTARLASPAWELYGKTGLVGDTFPGADKPLQEGCVSYHMRTGGHNLTPYDWDRYMDFADRHGWRHPDVVIENARFRLTVGGDAIVKSLKLKATGEELLDLRDPTPLVSVTQPRPFNNEIKLAYPNTRTTYPANSLRWEDGRLVVGFEIAPYEAALDVKVTDDYVAFALKDFIVTKKSYPLSPTSPRALDFTPPPVDEFRLVQLPVRNRANFGSWMNVMWDDKASVGVFATSPHALVSADRRTGYRLMGADADRRVRLRGTGAALVVDRGGEAILDRMAALERDYGLPRGVENRRNPLVNASIYFACNVSPADIDRQIALAKTGGFRLMEVESANFLGPCGDWNYRKEYPNGLRDAKVVFDKIRAAGIVPGMHILHTFVTPTSSIVKGGADHRLQLREIYTLARPLQAGDTEAYVDENTMNAELSPKCRILKFGRELMTYEGFTTERPFKFTGLKRGYADTPVSAHEEGLIGGTLWVCEYGGYDYYLKQDSDLQDLIADKIGEFWKAGLGFIYFDGSEGVCAPFAYHVPNAQYRMWRKLDPQPILGEGAAKAHFGWHMLSGANAFDVFAPEEFKAKIVEYPLAEAPLMRQDFTRVNFGWWGFWLPGRELRSDIKGRITIGTQADMWEFGTSKAASWDAPASIQMRPAVLERHPRLDDILEVMRRWEDVRAKNWLTKAQKLALRDPKREFHLLLNGKGEYELVEIRMLAERNDLRAFSFVRGGKTCAAYWHPISNGSVRLALRPDQVELLDAPDGPARRPEADGAGSKLATGALAYLRTDVPPDALAKAFCACADSSDGWRPLFAPDYSDGDCDPAVWHLDADGNLTAEKDVAFWTKDEYSRFELECEYNLDPAANSGVVIYCSDPKNWISNSVEIQLLDNEAPKWKGLNPRQANLSFFGHQAPTSNPARPAGEWNSFRLRADGQRLEVFLNGTLVNACDLSQWTDAKKMPDGSEIPPWLSRPWAELATTGRIGFQGRHAGARVRFRNIRIRPLPSTRPIRRLMSYNVRMGCGHDDPFSLPKGSLGHLPQCARVIGDCRPDCCGLQEVDRFSKRAGEMDQTAELAKLCGMEGSWVEKIPRYGISTLYRERPFRVSKVLMKGRIHTRALMISEFPDCVVANTHYPLSAETCNAAAETTLRTLAPYMKTKPVFLMGDFNSTPDSEAVRIIRRQFEPLTHPKAFTWSAKKPDRTIDYIFIDKAHAGQWTVLSRKVLPVPDATDHAALLVEIAPSGAKNPEMNRSSLRRLRVNRPEAFGTSSCRGCPLK